MQLNIFENFLCVTFGLHLVPHHKVKYASGFNRNKNFLETNFTFPQMVLKYIELQICLYFCMHVKLGPSQ